MPWLFLSLLVWVSWEFSGVGTFLKLNWEVHLPWKFATSFFGVDSFFPTYENGKEIWLLGADWLSKCLYCCLAVDFSPAPFWFSCRVTLLRCFLGKPEFKVNRIELVWFDHIWCLCLINVPVSLSRWICFRYFLCWFQKACVCPDMLWPIGQQVYNDQFCGCSNV